MKGVFRNASFLESYNFIVMYLPNCVVPHLLVNRAAVNLIPFGGRLYLDNQPSIYINHLNYNDFSFKPLFKMVEGKEDSYIDGFYVQRGNHKEPLFIYAACGHCELCHHRKQIDFVSRCNMESQLYDCPPYFFTLTYRPADLPSHGELRYKDVQDFFKRLRRSWDRQGIEHNIRYVVACEYGSNPRFSHRPHYHVILWNNPYKANELLPSLHKRLAHDIFKAWGHSEWSAFDFGQCAGGAAGYVSKYISKPNMTYGHWTKPSIHTSIGDGGIGSGLIKSKKSYYHANPHLRVFTYLDKSSFQVVHQNFGSYITQHLFPSPTRLVPATIKLAYKEFSELCMLGFSLGFLSLSQCKDYIELVRPYKNVIVNRFSHKLVRNYKRINLVGLCRIYYLNRFCKYLDEIAQQLIEVDEIPQSYLDIYYKFKSYNKDMKREDIGFKVLESKHAVAQIYDKSYL